MKLKKILITLGLLVAAIPSVNAQDVNIKTNLLYDALLSPTLGVEFGLAPKWSMDISGTINAWTVDERKWKQWMVQPEARYWFCQRFSGHFLGMHVLGGQYNFGNFGQLESHPWRQAQDKRVMFLGTNLGELWNHRLQGWFVGAGVAYGYTWILDRHWSFEAEIGLGWIYTRFDKFNCAGCGKKVEPDKVHNYVGPTKAALNIIYVF